MLFARRPNQVGSAHALRRIMAAYQKSSRVYWEHDEIDPRSVRLNYLFISLGGNLLVHLGIDRSGWLMHAESGSAVQRDTVNQ